ncbi:rhamnan synthesis F family protein [Synechococcus sp. AH-558-M21]|nr:rhamnan synthesis F family protein [Synechococcus sp. AH-558-M21]
MTRWLCRIQPEELPDLCGFTAIAKELGISGWILPVSPETVDAIESLLPEWPAGMQLCLEFNDAPASFGLLDQALAHPAAALFQGRPLLLIGSCLISAELKQRDAALFGPEVRPSIAGVSGQIPSGDEECFLNYQWFLQQSHLRGASNVVLMPAVRALSRAEEEGFIHADALHYQAWLELETAWSSLQLDAMDATVLIESWTGHQRWWPQRDVQSHPTMLVDESIDSLLVGERRWGVMQSKHLAIAIHGYYLDQLEAMLKLLPTGGGENDWPGIDLYISTPREQLVEAAELLRRLGWPRVRLFGVSNRGRDMAPFLLQLLPAIEELGHSLVIKLHTKASLHMQLGMAWGQHLLTSMLRPEILQYFDSNPDLGIVGPPGSLHRISLNLANNEKWLRTLCMDDLEQQQSLLAHHFLSGSMFVARVNVLKLLFNLDLKINDFELEAGQEDGTLAHALERWIGIMTETNGYSLEQFLGDDELIPDFGFASAKKTIPKTT